MTQRGAEKRDEFAEDDYPLQELTRQIIGAFYEVNRAFGYGLLEAAYRRAMAVELGYQDIRVAQEVPFELLYRGVSVGLYRADLVVENAVIVETKAGITLDPASTVQLLNYLKVSRLQVGLLLHFGLRPGVKRIVDSKPRA